MRRIIVPLIMAIVCAGELQASSRATLFLDGALIERELPAKGGVVELSLPAGVDPATVRVSPLGNGKVTSVDFMPLRVPKQIEKEIAQLDERRKALDDRLKALAVREEVFKAAAKSQSGKSPRKTKTNPQPLATIRQGTEYAISQLEAVYRMTRKATEDRAAVESRLAILKREGNVGGKLLKVRVSGKEERIAVRYAQKDLHWEPSADIRIKHPAGELLLSPHLPQLPAGMSVTIVPAVMEQKSAAPSYELSSAKSNLPFPLTIEREEALSGVLPVYRFVFANPLPPALLPLTVSCYRQGEYLGRSTISPVPDGQKTELTCGK